MITIRSTEVAEPGDFGMDNQLPRLGYRGRYVSELLFLRTERLLVRRGGAGHARAAVRMQLFDQWRGWILIDPV